MLTMLIPSPHLLHRALVHRIRLWIRWNPCSSLSWTNWLSIWNSNSLNYELKSMNCDQRSVGPNNSQNRHLYRVMHAASVAPDDGWTVVQERRQKKVICDGRWAVLKAAMQKDSCKRDVEVSGAAESNDDQNLVSELCQKMEFTTKPSTVARLGKKSRAIAAAQAVVRILLRRPSFHGALQPNASWQHRQHTTPQTEVGES